MQAKDERYDTDVYKYPGDFAIMATKGWRWFIIAAPMEVAIPGLANFLQSTLNASNTIAILATEIETALAMVGHMRTNRKGTGNAHHSLTGDTPSTSSTYIV